MLQAINSQGQLITLAQFTKEEIEHLRKNEKFYCPQCKKRVMMKAGNKIIPHFAHIAQSNCQLRHKGEGPYHKKGKLLLFKWLKKQTETVFLEHYMDEIEKIPDVLLVIGNKRIAVEFQASTIANRLIHERTVSYQSAHILPLWILGAHHFKRYGNNQFKVNQFILQFIYRFNPQLKTSLYFFCPQTKTMIMLTHIYTITNQRAYAKMTTLPLEKLTFIDLFKTPSLKVKDLLNFWNKEKRKFRLHSRHRVFGHELQWRKWLYNRGFFIENLPSLVHLPVESSYLFRVPLWNWQSRFIIDIFENIPLNGTFTLHDVHLFFKRFLFNETLFPLQKCIRHPIQQYLTYFKYMDYVTTLKTGVYKKIRHVSFYDHIEEAVEGDEHFIMLLKKYMHNEG